MVLTKEEEIVGEKVAQKMLNDCLKSGIDLDSCINAKIDGLFGIADIANNLPKGPSKDCANKLVDISNEIEDKIRFMRTFVV